MKKIAILSLFVSLLSACSNYKDNDTYKLTKQEKQTHGASYTHPRPIVNYKDHPVVPVLNMKSHYQIEFDPDFFKQLKIVQNASSLKKFHSDYQKLEQWYINSRYLDELADYGLDNLHILSGERGYFNVLMTAYFSPFIEVTKYPTAQYKYPIYARPNRFLKASTRAEIIFDNVLANQNLELAYTDSLVKLTTLMFQGSGFVKFKEDGSLGYLQYAGTNGYRAKGLAKIAVNNYHLPKKGMSLKKLENWMNTLSEEQIKQFISKDDSWVYYKLLENQKYAKGSAGIELVANAAAAVDPKVIEAGTILLVEEPVLDQNNSFKTHKPRLLIALDRGGLIKHNHIDIYRGIGNKAKKAASAVRHYGKIWLLNYK